MLLLRNFTCALLLMTAPLAVNAHHSTAFNYSDEMITLEGTITAVKWVNPHGSFVLEVTNADGLTDEWFVEFLARIALERQGFDFDSLQNGVAVKLTGRIGFREGYLRFREAELEDGRIIREQNPTLED
ncbi:MAG: hypothetical protein E2O65_08885 [Gammaproteobacteria bacterium]|nr:MAG: hypothetical protein E2O65_08885 [Gammaproteobacteria bacterium]